VSRDLFNPNLLNLPSDEDHKMGILEIKNLNKKFGGLHAIKNINLNIRQGELSSIIGPNGAGKTTLFNLITGSLLPDSGSIVFEGKNITGMQTFQLAKIGIGMAFQKTNIFPRMTAYENVETALIARTQRNMNFISSINKFADIITETLEILDSMGLSDKVDSISSTLSHGDQKLLDIAIAIALKPKLLLIDEPTAGMSPEERRKTIGLLKKLWKEMNMTLLFIEHDMDMVFSISEIIRVLYHGELIAEGKPEEIANNPQVIEAYLGEET